MAWQETLTKLQQKPEADRRRIAWWSSLALTLMIAIVWSVSLRFTLESGSTELARVEPHRQTALVAGAEIGWWGAARERIKIGWQKLTN